MVTKGIFKRVSGRGELSPNVDVLVARVVFSSKKYAEWFEDCANRVCKYEHEHGHLLSGFFSVAGASHYDPALTASQSMSVEFCTNRVIPGACFITYCPTDIDDVLDILSLVSTVQAMSVNDVRRDVDVITATVCHNYEMTFGQLRKDFE